MARRPPLKKYRVILILIGLLLAPAYFYYQSSQGMGGQLRWSERISVWLLSPVFHSMVEIRGKISTVIHRYFYLVNTAKENEKLRSELQQYHLKEIFYEGIARESERLTALIDFQKHLDFQTIPARVISFSPVGEFQIVTVDRGKEEGIRRGAVVLSSKGLVGRVIKVYPHESQILLVTDPTSVVDAEVKRTGARGLVVGRGVALGFTREIFVGAFELWESSQEVADSDILLTSGLDGVFPKNLPIGTTRNVRKGEFDVFINGDVVPFVDFYKLREVLILKP
ncbi:MAG: rod shape-determining protein MreC [Deltaproteobacteria bacterium]|nr:rod shape-determining protein MreC [Deltaproteobacteria bacterium]